MSRKYDIVVLGNSAAGLTFINTFRKYDKNKKILLIDREDVPAYSRVLTPYYISGKYGREDIFIVDEKYYEGIGVDTLLGETVVDVDFDKREVRTDKGSVAEYDYLFIGLGAEAKKTGFESDKVLTLRHIKDADKMADFFKNAKSAVGFGAGLVTIPLLSHLREDVKKYLVVSSGRVFSRVVDKDASALIEEAMVNAGVKIYKHNDLKDIEDTEKGLKFKLKSGDEIFADFGIVGKGVDLNVGLFENTPLEIGWGVKIDKFARTNIENVYAGGDIAQDFDFITKEETTQGNWITAVEHAETAAKHILGVKDEYEGSLKNNTTEIFGIEVAVVGYVGDDAKSVTYYNKQANLYRRVFLDENGVIIGCSLINETNDAGAYYGLVKRRVKFDKFYRPGKFHNFAKLHYGTLKI